MNSFLNNMSSRIKISFTIISMLAFAIIGILKADIVCDEGMCEDTCKTWDLNGRCVGNGCKCSNGKKCSELIGVTCGYLCGKLNLHLDGECDENGICVCKAKLKPCDSLFECVKQCADDPRTRDCIMVTPVFCMWYGPIHACGCLCYMPGNDSRLNGVNKKTFYSFDTGNSSQYDHYFLSGNSV